MLSRDSSGYVLCERQIVGGTVRLTETLLGVVGYASVSGYLGSSVYGRVKWAEGTLSRLHTIFKRTLSEAFAIYVDSNEAMEFDFREVRSFLDDYGVSYIEEDRVVPSFLLDDYETQARAYLKGVFLGLSTAEAIKAYSTTGIYTVSFSGESMYDSIQELLTLLAIPYLSDEETFSISLISGPGSLTEWFLDQKAGFLDGPEPPVLAISGVNG